jgi:hypothetical protein
MAAEEGQKTAKARGTALTECKTHRLCQPVGPPLRPTKPPEAAGGSAKETKRFYNSLGVDSRSLNFVSIPKDANAKEQSH